MQQKHGRPFANVRECDIDSAHESDYASDEKELPRASGSDEAMRLVPVKDLSLEEALEFIGGGRTGRSNTKINSSAEESFES